MNKLTAAVLSILLIFSFTAAEELYGPLSGTIQTGEYTIVDSISVEDGDTLVIESGAVFMFTDSAAFDVRGTLLALGTESDSIKFIAESLDSLWCGIAFYIWSGYGSRMDYCSISGSLDKGIKFFAASPRLINCKISGCYTDSYGGGLYIINASPLIESCEISGNQAEIYGGGVYSSFDSHAEFVNCTIINNTSDYYGGGIYIVEANPSFTVCTIENNLALSYGGGVFCAEYSFPKFLYCDFISNNGNYGGGAYLDEFSNPVFQECDFLLNTTDLSGAGIYTVNSTADIIDCNFQANVAASVGGGLTITQNSELRVIGCTFQGNYAESFGGVECIESNSLMENCLITGNSALFKGGGVGCEYSPMTFIDCTIEDNVSGTYAGGMRIKGSDIDDSPILQNCRIIGNSATDNRGGGIDCRGGNPYFERCLFENNSSKYGGGLSFIWDSEPVIENCNFISNSVDSVGASIYCQNTDLTISNSIFYDNTGDSEIHFYAGASSDIAYCDFFGGFDTWFTGEASSNLGDIVTVNNNNDSSDVYFNIYQNPMFYALTGDSAYYLTENSPCIDAGNPYTPLDPDSTIADMGLYYYDHWMPVIDDVTITIDGDDVQLNWIDVPGAVSYYIYRSETPYFSVFASEPVAETSVSEFVDEDAANEVKWYYRVTYGE